MARFSSDPIADTLINDLFATGLRDLAGGRVTARIPLSQALVNRLVTAALDRVKSPVRSVDVHPHAGNQFDVFVKIATWMPAVKIAVTIDQQPEPASPLLVLRWSALGGLGAMAANTFGAGAKLPPGVRLEGDRLVLDVAVLIRQAGGDLVLPYLRRLHVTTEEGRIVMDAELAVNDVVDTIRNAATA